jgi:DUF4097 and DUF4098 domain-containing protein YvlB
MTPESTNRTFLRRASVGLLLVVPVFSGCSAILANAVRAKKVEQRSFYVQRPPAVTVETFNGEITVSAAESNKVEAVVTKTGSGATQEAAEADLENVKLDFAQDGDKVRIVATRTGPKMIGSSGASIDLKVPPASSLSLTTSNGELVSKGVQGEITARSSNGQIEVDGARAKLDLETSNGEVKVDAIGAVVNARSTNGNVAFNGSLAKGSHSLSTSNGGLRLALPSSTPFQFSAATSNGTIQSSFSGLKTTSGKPGGNHWSASMATGSDADIQVHLETSNGTITIEPLHPAEAPIAK